jgi:hypothetical protein
MVVAVLATVRDPDGRLVELTDERWAHILDRHGVMRTLQIEVLHTIGTPTLARAGREQNERWYFLADTGPSRWLQAVIAYREERWFIVSAFPRRRLP